MHCLSCVAVHLASKLDSVCVCVEMLFQDFCLGECTCSDLMSDSFVFDCVFQGPPEFDHGLKVFIVNK